MSERKREKRAREGGRERGRRERERARTAGTYVGMLKKTGKTFLFSGVGIFDRDLEILGVCVHVCMRARTCVCVHACVCVYE